MTAATVLDAAGGGPPPRAATLDKAQRLREQERVSELDAYVFAVEGDHGVYRVIAPKGQPTPMTCDCPARGACSHMYAVLSDLRAKADAGRDPFELIGVR